MAGRRVNDVARMFLPTIRLTPQEATLRSHTLMLRAGMMQQSSAGVYALLPLGLRMFEKVQRIVDEELHQVGGQKMALPCLTPAALWQQSGRWQAAGAELMRLEDRRGHAMCIAPTCEETVTEAVASFLTSHRQLPVRLYQLDRKFRDEARPRAGLIRAREFWMMDMYCFDRDQKHATITYNDLALAYDRVFARLALPVVRVEADMGLMGGVSSHEYHLPAAVGEDTIMACSGPPGAADPTSDSAVAAGCGYAANVEQAVTRHDAVGAKGGGAVAATRIRVVRSNAAAAPASEERLVIHPASRPINPASLRRKLLGEIEELDNSSVQQTDNGKVVLGGLEAGGGALLVDESLAHCLAPSATAHASTELGQWTMVQAGDACPAAGCTGRLHEHRGIELGHAFLLGTRYSEAFNAVFTDELAEMSCFGLGITRIMAALVEHYCDDDGIVLPGSVAPYKVCVVVLNGSVGKHHQERAESMIQNGLDLYHALDRAFPGDVLMDTSDRSNGVKLNEAALLGHRWVVVVGVRHSPDRLEVRFRPGNQRSDMSLPALLEAVAADAATGQ